MSKTLVERARRYAAFVLMEGKNRAIDADTLASRVRGFGAQCSTDLITHSLPSAGFYDVKDDMYSPYSQGRKLYALDIVFYEELMKQTKEIACIKTDDEVIGFIREYKLCRTRPKLMEIFNRAAENYKASHAMATKICSDSPRKQPRASPIQS